MRRRTASSSIEYIVIMMAFAAIVFAAFIALASSRKDAPEKPTTEQRAPQKPAPPSADKDEVPPAGDY